MERRIHKKGLLVFSFIFLFVISVLPAFAQSIPGATEAIGGKVQWLYTTWCPGGRPMFNVLLPNGQVRGPFGLTTPPLYKFYMPLIPGINTLFNASTFPIFGGCVAPCPSGYCPALARTITLPGIGSSLFP